MQESPCNSGSLAISPFPGMADPHTRISERARILAVIVAPLISQECFLAAVGSKVSAESSLEPSGLWPPSPGEPGSRGRDLGGGRLCFSGERSGVDRGRYLSTHGTGQIVRPIVRNLRTRCYQPKGFPCHVAGRTGAYLPTKWKPGTFSRNSHQSLHLG